MSYGIQKTTRCRACGAEIMFIPTMLYKKTPVDAEPVYIRPDTNSKKVFVLPTGGTINGEPVGDAVDASCLELIIVPAVALDGKRNRLGRGKGFYDRLLSTTDCPTIGVACDFQLVDEVPVEPHDRPLDCVVTSDTVLTDNPTLFA